jgi:hypothetical protein
MVSEAITRNAALKPISGPWCCLGMPAWPESRSLLKRNSGHMAGHLFLWGYFKRKTTLALARRLLCLSWT